MSQIVDKLLIDNVKSLTPYASARRLFSAADNDVQQTWLNANESPYTNAYDMDDELFNRYPDCQPAEVIRRYAQYSGLSSAQTLVTRGADEGIELLIRTFCEPDKDSVLICPPTYGMYAISAHTCNVGVTHAPLNDDFSLDVDGICQHKGQVKLVFICSPNNPTGTSVNAQHLQQIIEHYADSALVVVDEAYIEFDWHNSWAPRLKEYENLVVLRTLSKAFALAGIRCGFTLASDAIVSALLKVIAPYPVPSPVAQVAEQALSENGLQTMRAQVAHIDAEKATLERQLTAIEGLDIVGDDKANFILFRHQKNHQLMAYLVANHMLIRDQSKQLTLENCLRITVGSPKQNALLMQHITTFFTNTET